MRLVLDTSVLVAGVRSSLGASRQVLRAALTGKLLILASVPFMLEYEAVLSRPEHLEAAGLSVAEVEVLLDGVAAVAERVRLSFLWRPQLRDPDDDLVLETAVNGQAAAIVTLNRRDFEGSVSRFGLQLWSPAEAWRSLGKEKHAQE